MTLSHRIAEVFSILGLPHYRVALPSFDEPFVQQASWKCGCVVDYVDEKVGAFEWDACASHSSRSAPLPNPRFPAAGR